jgi:peptide/nickel transport system permease protein
MLRGRGALLLGLMLIAVFVAAAVFAPSLAPHSPTRQNLMAARQPPSITHPFGTDEVGRDLLSRVIHGTRISFVVGLVAVGIATVVGVPLGLLSGYLGGAVDLVISRLLETIFAFPAVLMALAVTAVLGRSVETAMIAIGIVSIPEFARVARSAIIAVKENPYVEASRALGSSNAYIIARVLMPNMLGPLLVLLSLGFGYAILNEAALSFLGVGAQPPAPAWGSMLSSGKSYLHEAPWYGFFPGLAIFLLVIAANLIGDGLRDLADPRRKRIEA